MGSDWEKFKKVASPLEEVRHDREKVWAKKVKNPILNVKKCAYDRKNHLDLDQKISFRNQKVPPNQEKPTLTKSHTSLPFLHL